MDEIKYKDIENWYGSFYELSIQISPIPNTEKLFSSIQYIFNGNRIIGPWADISNFMNIHSVTETCLNEVTCYYGLAKIGDKIELGVSVSLVREEDANDWLTISLPTGMLELVYDVKYPLYIKNNPWLKEADKFFIEIADGLYQNIKFEFGIIGEEVSGYLSESEINHNELKKGGFLITKNTYKRLNTKINYIELKSGLLYIQPNGMLNITYSM